MSLVTWLDKAGNLWLFGGLGCDADGNCAQLDDLWKYSPVTNEWAWMAGDSTLPGPYLTQAPVYGTFQVPSPGNTPGARQNPAVWTDSAGNLWLFGGFYETNTATTTYYSYLNDLWEFDTTLNQWAWMAGSSTLPVCGTGPITCNQQGVYGSLGTPAAGNLPGGRHGAATWTDGSGNVWLFGGRGADSTGVVGELNDLWEFNPSNMQWAWMGGSSTLPTCEAGAGFCAAPGVYGTKGQPAAGNIPGGRDGSVTWIDKQGNFWLFAGGSVNDLWQFSPSTEEWTWVSGSNSDASFLTLFGIYGTLQVPAPGNVPGMRSGAVGWTDANGDLWLFGGEGADSVDDGVYLNDLWKFDPTRTEWTWMDGDSSLPYRIVGQAGYYGNLGQAAFGNIPGSRASSAAWTDSKGNFWLFGGGGFDASLDLGYLNDLWTYQPYTGGQTTVATPSFTPSPGAYPETQSVAISDTTPGTTIYYLIGNQGPATQYTEPLRVSSLETIQAMASAPGYANSTVAQATYIVDFPQCSPPMFDPGPSPPPSYYTQAISVYFFDATPGATIYYTTNGTTPTTQSAQYSGPVTVSTNETIQAFAVAPGYSSSPTESASYVFNLAPSPTFNPPGGNYSTPQQVTISDSVSGATIYYSIGATPTTPNIPYNGPITVSSSEILQAMAVADNYMNSAVATAAYNIGPSASGLWAWMGGSSSIPSNCPTGNCGMPGWYGTLGVPAPANIPGARTGASTWIDNNGNFWLFGGAGYDSAGNTGYLNDLWEFNPATSDWAWISGADTITCTPQLGCLTPGVFGSLGVPNATATPGGRSNAASWTDANGKLWLFGGLGADGTGNLGFLNDVWKFDPSTNEWTWMGGSEAVPDSCFLTFCGQPGQYGAIGTAAVGNIPGGRQASASWTDRQGNFWIFGGLGYDSAGRLNYLNDLWELNPSTNEWAWMSGSSFGPGFEQGWVGDYGTLGVPAVGNNPWSLISPATWTDSNGNLWLFGGLGVDPNAVEYPLNDMWEYFPSLNEWAWTSANGYWTGGANCVYGASGEFSPANIPTTRYESASWTDANGNLWLFGGNELWGDTNDLWEFKPSINQWALMSGECLQGGLAGQYGALGVPASGNAPGSRRSPVSWVDRSGNLWLFGGFGADAQGNAGTLNDLWQYGLAGAPTVPPPTPASAPSFNLAAGTYNSGQNLTISDQTAGATIYYTTNGTAPSANSAIYSAPISIPASETVQAVAVASGYAVSPLATATYTINLPQAATPAFSVPAGIYTSTQSVTISDSTSGATIYYTTDGSTPTTSSTKYAGPITVSATETIEAIAVATNYSNSAVASAIYTISLPPPSFAFSASPASLTIDLGASGTSTLTVTPQNGFASMVSFACSGLPASAACSFSPTTVTPSGAAVTAKLTIAVGAQAAMTRHDSDPLFPITELAAVVGLFAWKRRRGLRGLLVLLLIAAGMGLSSGCGGGGTGGGGGGGGGGPQNYTVIVTATSGSIQQTANISVTVN